MQPVFLARLIRRQMLSLLGLADCFRFRHLKSFTFLEHFARCDLLVNVFLLKNKELYITCRGSEQSRLASLSPVYPLNSLDTLRNILGIKYIETFCMSLKFSKIIKVSLSLLILNSLEKNNSTTTISNRKNVPNRIKTNC